MAACGTNVDDGGGESGEDGGRGGGDDEVTVGFSVLVSFFSCVSSELSSLSSQVRSLKWSYWFLCFFFCWTLSSESLSLELDSDLSKPNCLPVEKERVRGTEGYNGGRKHMRFNNTS